MIGIPVVGTVAKSNPDSSKTSSVKQRTAVYTIQPGDNIDNIAQKFDMTPEQFRKWTGFKEKFLKKGQKINLPQSKVPESMGIKTLANKYNMDFEAFCRLNKIPKPYKNYIIQKDEMFYVCKNYGKSYIAANEDRQIFQNEDPQTNKETKYNFKTVTYNGKKYRQERVPQCGYRETIGGRYSVASTDGSYPSVPVDSKGRIVAEVIKFGPSVQGELTGKTIMVNAGHGWGYSYDEDTKTRKKVFDIGSETKDENGKKLEEWNRNRQFADNLISSLCANGAAVIYTTGKIRQACDAKKNFGTDMLISIHCNAVTDSSFHGIQVLYAQGSNSSEELANIVKKNFRANVNQNTITLNDAESSQGTLGILRTRSQNNKIPSIILEMGFMSNPEDIINIDKKSEQQKSMEQVTKSVIEYMKLQEK